MFRLLKKKLLENDNLNLYTIVDTTVDRMIYSSMRSEDTFSSILYADEADQKDLKYKAPYLVRLEAKGSFFEQLLGVGYGNNWGCFISSKYSDAVLLHHFRKYTKVYSAGHGQDIYMRFYDPRALSKYFKMLSPKDISGFFEKIEALYIEKENEFEILYKYTFSKREQRILREEIFLMEEGAL